MQSTTVACLALLCFAVAIASTVSAQSPDGESAFQESDQYGVESDSLNLAKAALPQLRNRCRSMGNCVHDKICDSNCKQFGYKDGECSGRSCICCA